MDLDKDFHVVKAADAALGQGDVEIRGYRLRQWTIRISAHQFHCARPWLPER
jgi:hypothetical protein